MTDKTRRKFVTIMSAGAAVVPLSALVTALPSHAEDLPMLDPASEAAKGLQYVESSVVDNSTCVKCMHYQGAEDSAKAPCVFFQGYVVSANGYCVAYAVRG